MSKRPEYRGMTPAQILEAALFSAGKPLAVEDIMHETGLGKKAVNDGLKVLQKAYKDRDTVLEIGKGGAKWGMQVKTMAAEPAARFAPMEVPKKVLKTLALIAYHQPMKQSELVEMIGSKTYEHVAELKERGLVKTRKDGITKILSTTQAFPEYFGLDATDQEQVRIAMAKLVGLPPPKKREEQSLGTFGPPGAPADEAAGQESMGETKATPPGDAPRDPAENRDTDTQDASEAPEVQETVQNA